MIRLPDFVTREDFVWSRQEASGKKKMDCSRAKFFTLDEGLCVQIMHIGLYDEESSSIALMDRFIQEKGYSNDFDGNRRHHEIYLSDVRKTAPERWKTVIRHPIVPMEG